MKLYKIGAFLAVLLCVFALVFSYLTWQDKLENVLEQPEEQKTQTSGKKEASTKETKEQNNGELSVNIKELSANADQAVQDLLIERSDNGEKVQLLIAGSAALDSGNPGYAERLKESLETSYEDFIEVDVLSLTGTSEALIGGNVDLSAGYDIVLLEPMTLMNNDRIAIEQEREHISEFNTAVTAEVEDAVVVLHPPQPIFGAGYYLAQVSALEEFAAIYGYAYIDHWSVWPDTDDEALKDFLTEDGLPNDKGAELWTEELEAYFIAE
ncbi:SGNH/GDSL hydrolase family protein [Planococcus wigleyi]|uniref:SGNH/GDSL hydrolase family protein n=1 Tax=Planococcus wigleyi TaxID=2762216 RepID=A0ABR8W970_9BACL|nr:SGNH/GDSL hydrolase family protein [Planococcus wigleyi]MBD8013361.1 SGNH/GDSL hydrolase family protein [Planococcus wigleyi]